MDAGGEPVLRLIGGRDVVGEYEEKRSKFIAYLRRVDDEVAARDMVAELRSAYPEARHHCSAHLVDVSGMNRIERSNDDGEPSGTAGTPILDVLRGSGLTGIAAVVVRWFGGTKLGTGGLARAYGAAVREAIDQAWRDDQIVEAISCPAWRTDVDHSVAGGLESALRAAGVAILHIEYGPVARVTVAGEWDVLGPILAARTSGGASWESVGRVTTENAASRRDMPS